MNKRLLSICKRKLDLNEDQVQLILEKSPEALPIIEVLLEGLGKCGAALSSVQSGLMGARKTIQQERERSTEYLIQLQQLQILINDSNRDPNPSRRG